MKSKIEALILKLDTQGDHAAEKVIGKIVKWGKVATPFLITAAQDQSRPRIRKWSLQALGHLGDSRGAPLLVKALKDPRMTVRLHAVKGLGRMKYKKGLRAISALLKDDSGGIRVNALSALIAIGDKAALPAIQKCLDDPKWYVRQEACVACGRFASAKAKRKLIQLTKLDDRKAVRTAAKAALEKI